MTTVDLWAFLAAAVAGSAIGIRAHMLRPHQTAWTQAPALVWVTLSVTALALAMAAVTILYGAHASQREATVYSVLAVCAVAMLWNLNRNGRAAQVERERIAGEVRLTMELSGPPATYPGEWP